MRCRQVAALESGDIYVAEVGMGIGIVALSALALNDELDGRVKVLGFEQNPQTFQRAQEVFEHFDVPHEWYYFQQGDAMKNPNILPPNVRILVAEHVGTGVFTAEPLYEIHRAFIPRLQEPYFVIPSGLQVFGRAVRTEDFVDIANAPEDIISAAVREALKVFSEFDGFMEIPWRFLNRHFPPSSPILSSSRIGAIDFVAMSKKSRAQLSLEWQRHARQSGQGYVEIRNVPVFHNDGDSPRLLSPPYYLADQALCPYPTQLFPGTMLTEWRPMAVEESVRAFFRPYAAQILASGRDPSTFDPSDVFQIARDTPECATKAYFERGQLYTVCIKGSPEGNFPDEIKISSS